MFLWVIENKIAVELCLIDSFTDRVLDGVDGLLQITSGIELLFVDERVAVGLKRLLDHSFKGVARIVGSGTLHHTVCVLRHRKSIVCYEKLLDLAPLRRLAVHKAWRHDHMLGKALIAVQVVDELGLGVGEHDVGAFLVQFINKISQAYLVFFGKVVLGVGGKGRLRRWVIGRVEVHKIPLVYKVTNDLKISTNEMRFLQGKMTDTDLVRLHNVWIFIAPHRSIELAAFVDPIQTVEAGFIEIQKACRHFERISWLLFSDLVVVVLGVRFVVLLE